MGELEPSSVPVAPLTSSYSYSYGTSPSYSYSYGTSPSYSYSYGPTSSSPVTSPKISPSQPSSFPSNSPSIDSSSAPTELSSSQPSYPPTTKSSPPPTSISTASPSSAKKSSKSSKKSSPGGCCSWDQASCGSSAWCDQSKYKCENNCNGFWLDPNAPPPPPGCCSWGNGCGNSAWCSASEQNCNGPCQGTWIPLSGCVSCSDNETPWMRQNNEDCTNSNLIDTKCNKNPMWRQKKYCRFSCYEAGNGYSGDVCCDR